MGFLQRIFSTGLGAKSPAKALYAKLMRQSRRPEFFGEGRFPDSYDGRLDLLTMHLCVLMANVQAKERAANIDTGKNNENSLSQHIFDVMVNDLDTALREEGYTDTGVKRRIKPMIGFFYKRLKTLTESLGEPENIKSAILEGSLGDEQDGFARQMAGYLSGFHKNLEQASLDEILKSEFAFPNF